MKAQKRPYFNHLVIEVTAMGGGFDSIEWVKDKISLLLGFLQIKPIKEISHKFMPQGISLVSILSSSHIAAHSWPEGNYLHIDLITCTKGVNENKVRQVAGKVFPESKLTVSELSY